jgi:hypothetical protein
MYQRIIGFFIVSRRLPAAVLHPCWENKKFEDAAFIPWVDCTLEQQAFHLGVVAE